MKNYKPAQFNGAYMRRVREAEELSLQGLAELTGASSPALSSFEHGRSIPNSMLLHDIARMLNVTMDSFFEDDRLRAEDDE